MTGSHYRTTIDNLTPMEYKFVENYCRHWHAGRAVREAGYLSRTDNESYYYDTAYRLTHDPRVQAAIERRLKEQCMDATEALRRLADMARGSIEEFLTIDEETGKISIDLVKAQRAGKLHLVRKLGVNPLGQAQIELYDAEAALVHIGKHLRLFAEKVEMSGVMTNVDLSKLSEDDLSQLEAILSRAASSSDA